MNKLKSIFILAYLTFSNYAFTASAESSSASDKALTLLQKKFSNSLNEVNDGIKEQKEIYAFLREIQAPSGKDWSNDLPVTNLTQFEDMCEEERITGITFKWVGKEYSIKTDYFDY